MLRVYILLLLTISYRFAFSQNEPVMLGENLKEQIVVFTDRDLYLTGEQIWFSAFVKVGDSLSSTQLSEILYVELFDNNNVAINSLKFRINSSLVKGAVNIPKEIVSGNYYLRVYTKFLRNYSVNDFPCLTVKIINPLISLPEEKVIVENVGVEIFPEGGSFIENTNNNVSIRIPEKLVDQISTIDIVDFNNRVISKCEIFSSGLGYFNIIPLDGVVYKLKINKQDGGVEYLPFPKLLRKDMSIISDVDRDGLRIRIYLNPKRIDENQIFEMVLINSGGEKIFTEHFNFKENEYETFIPENRLSNGVNVVVVKNKGNKVINYTLNYIKKSKVPIIQISTDKTVYVPRELIKLTIEHDDLYLMENVSVVKKGTREAEDELPSLCLYDKNKFKLFLNRNDISKAEIINQINYVFNIFSDSAFVFSFIKPPVNKLVELKYLPERRGVGVSGIIKDKKTNQAIGGQNIFMSVFGDNKQLHICNTEADGRFYFFLKDLYGIQNIYLNIDNIEIENHEIKIDNNFETRTFENTSPSFFISEKKKNLLDEMFVNYQLSLLQNKENNNNEVAESYFLSDSAIFTSVIKLADFIKLESLKDVFHEIVPLVSLVDNDAVGLKIYNSRTGTYFSNPLVLIDNIPVFDIEAMLKLNPVFIERIAVVNEKYYLGDYLANGIISIHSKRNNFASIKFSSDAIFLKYKTLSYSSIPDFVCYESIDIKNNRSPDFRNCLYWDTKVLGGKEKTDYSFYASDHCAEYDIVCRCVTKEGKIIELSKTIRIEE